MPREEKKKEKMIIEVVVATKQLLERWRHNVDILNLLRKKTSYETKGLNEL